jgi:hypothetical protein
MKRWIVAAAIFSLALSACSTSTSSTNSNGIGQGAGSQDASADVELGSCKVNKLIGTVSCPITITNHSDGTSDYYIEGVVLDSKGTNVGDGNASASHVEAGGKAQTKFTGIIQGKATDVTVKITTVQRTASM